MGILDPSFGDTFESPKNLTNRGPHAEVPSAVPALPAIAPDLQAGFADLHKQQQAGVAAHQDYARRLKQVNDAAQERSSDLGLAERLGTMFDPQVPKSAKQFLFKEMSRTLGIDPATASAKEIGAMLTGLDPQGAASMRALIAEQAGTASPGALQGLMRGVLSGQVPMHQVVQMAGAAGQQRAAKVGEEVGRNFKAPLPGMMRAGAPTEAESAEPQSTLVPKSAAETPQRYQEVDPALAHALGQDRRARYTVDDFLQHNISIPSDPKERQELLERINTKTTTSIGLATSVAQVLQGIRGHPETVGLAGWGNRILDAGLTQAGAAAGSIVPEPIAGWARKLTEAFSSKGGFKPTADQSAQTQAAITGLAYQFASARGIKGQQLNVKMIENVLSEMGASSFGGLTGQTMSIQSPSQFEAAIGGMLKQTLSAVGTELATTTGRQSWNFDLSSMTKDQLKMFVDEKNSSLVTPEFRAAVAETWNEKYGTEADKKQLRGEVVPSGTIEANERALRRDATEAQKLKQEQTGREVEGFKLQKQRFELTEQRDKRTEARQIYQDKQSEARNARLEARQVQQDMAAERRNMASAFRDIGAMISRGVNTPSVGSSGGGDAGQDASAFKLPQRPQRTPPQIGRSGK